MNRSATVRVGDTLPPVRPAPITRTTLALFAGASGDHNPIHIDIDAAHAAGMADVFGHGMLTMAHAAQLLTGWIPQQYLRRFEVRFSAITPVHAEPLCTGRVTALDTVDGEQRATVELTVTLADGITTLAGQAVMALPDYDPSN
ncbi:MaoC/PaaZ C-terminal domain-containing protein [Nocardia carnea]|uniref:MaoC/PaaZ C-terminal domain-containing protein n=1 Tax=Nocardia carnea TaxID=37328 RepID=UPI002458074D|nr:MaoC/PaaZ C-terminal domain-containing protein [Nocardia carnea]